MMLSSSCHTFWKTNFRL